MSNPKTNSPLISSINSLGLNVLNALIKEGTTKSFVSPPLLSAGLSLVAASAVGTTRDQILETTNLPAPDGDGFATLIKDLSAGPVRLGQALWVTKDHPFQPTFADLSRDFGYHANEAAETPASEINDWAASATRGKNTFVARKEDVSPFLIANVAHFKGQWTSKFSRGNTAAAKFAPLDGELKSCKMMEKEGKFKYHSNENYQAVEMPYDDELSAVLILPTKSESKDNISSILETLSEDGLSSFLDKMSASQGRVMIPRFKVESRQDLASVLKTMGIQQAFSGVADYANLTTAPANLGLSTYLQSVIIEVNEEGLVGEPMSPTFSTNFTFKADHSFIFLLKEQESGVIVTLGLVDNQFTSEVEREAGSSDRKRRRSNSPSKGSPNRARSPSPNRRRNSSPGRRGRSPSPRSGSTCLFVGNLPRGTRDSDVEALFGEFGRIRSLRTGANKERLVFAFITFADRRAAEDAFDKYDGYTYKDHKLRLDWDAGLGNKPRPTWRSRRSPPPYYRRRSPSPRRRRSPYRGRRSPSPRGRSPRRRSPSPRRRSPSPRGRSPRRRSPSPRRRSPSPRRRSPSPSPRRGRSPSSRRGSLSPRRSMSP